MKKSTNNLLVFFGGLLMVTFSLIACSKDDGSNGNGPVISGVSPSNVATGTYIIISGERLDGSSVTVDGISAIVTTNTSTAIGTTIPAGVPNGVKEVKVTNAQGSATATVTVSSAPVITSITPADATKGGTITITGTGLASAVVEIATKVSVINSNTATSIVVVVPTTIALGAASVRVTTSVGTTVSNVNIIN